VSTYSYLPFVFQALAEIAVIFGFGFALGYWCGSEA